MLRLLWTLCLLITSPPSNAVKVKRRFSAEPEKVKIESRDRDVKLLPPKFVAEKYGLKEGDHMSEDVAKKIHEEAVEMGERPPSFFHVDDGEVLLLPEVFSMLDTEKVARDFAAEGDAEDEKELRDSRWWGRLYIDGWPQTVQYMRAHFGQPPPQGTLKVVLADPPTACGGLMDDQGGDKYKGAIVFARRGECTFSSKARVANRAKAAALVLVNNEPGNDHLAGPDAHDVELSVSMVAQADGELVLRVLERNAALAKRAPPSSSSSSSSPPQLTATMVPIHCTEKSAVLSGDALGNNLCAPATATERAFVNRPLEGGWIALRPHGEEEEKFEFMIATFGTMVSAGASSALEVAVAGEPWDTCSLLHRGGGLTFEEFNEKDAAVRNASTNGGLSACEDTEGKMQPASFLPSSAYSGKAVLIKRGGCPFIEKAKSAQAAGAAALLIANTVTGISRFGVEPRWKGLGITIPVVMVSDQAGDALAAAAAPPPPETTASEQRSPAKVSFALSKSVTASAWAEVDALREGDREAWGLPPLPTPKAKGRSRGGAPAALTPAEEASRAEMLTEVLKARKAAGVDAGWPEREAAVMQGFAKLCPSATGNSLTCPRLNSAGSDEL